MLTKKHIYDFTTFNLRKETNLTITRTDTILMFLNEEHTLTDYINSYSITLTNVSMDLSFNLASAATYAEMGHSTHNICPFDLR